MHHLREIYDSFHTTDNQMIVSPSAVVVSSLKKYLFVFLPM